MSSAVPERHPDQDQLADLAAEVLPVDLARSVEAHVMQCTLCERLLADAERVRRLLFVEDPGPMPAEVWLRLEGALVVEAAGRQHAAPQHAHAAELGWFDDPRQTAPAPVTPVAAPGPASRARPARIDLTESALHALPAMDPTPLYVDAPPPYVDAPPPYVQAPSPYVQAPSPDARRPYVDTPPAYTTAPTGIPSATPPPADAPVSVPPPPSPPPAMSFDEAPTAAWKAFLDEPTTADDTGPVPLRVGRVVRSSLRSRRDVREDRATGRRRGPILLAAAAAVVLLLGGVFAVSFFRGGHQPSGLGAADLGGAPARTAIYHTGRQYTASTLVSQVRALLATGATTAPSAAGSPTGTGAAATVADPNQLAACLTTLNESGHQVLAVDLAQYQGRDAAVIVLQGVTGGWDIWVVAPQCQASQVPMAFKAVAP